MFTVVFVSIIVFLVSAVVLNAISEEMREKAINWIKDTAKWMLICTITVAIFLAMFVLLPPAKADTSEFYYKVVFIDEIEDYNNKEYLLHTDDLDHLWDYWEDKKETFSNVNWDLENLAFQFIKENNLDAEIDIKTCLCRGRIVVLTMWECISEDPFDEEVVDVYYTAFITE